jgi:hypothetical protein
MTVTSVQARLSPKLFEIAAAIKTAMMRRNIAQNSVVSGAHFVSSCAPTIRSPVCSIRAPGSSDRAIASSLLGKSAVIGPAFVASQSILKHGRSGKALGDAEFELAQAHFQWAYNVLDAAFEATREVIDSVE